MLKKDRSKHMIFQLLIVTVSLYFLTPYTSLKYIRDKKGVFVTYVVRCNNSFMKSSFQRHTAKHIIIYISTYLISLSTLVWSIIFDYLFFSSIFASQSEDGIAYREGSIHQGDTLLEVNGVNLKKSSQEEACKALRVRKGFSAKK